MAAIPVPSGGGATINTTAASDLVELLRRLRSLGVLPDLAGDHHHDLSAAFERVLFLFFSEVLLQEPPALPAALGDGPSLDLFSLYSAARRHPHNWARTASDLSLRHPGAPSAVKLLYSKYLHPLHRWLSLVLDRPHDAQCDPVGQPLDRPPPPLRSEGKVRIFEEEREEEKKKKRKREEEKKKEEESVGDALVSVKLEEEEDVKEGNGKRKRGDLAGMLRWLRGVAMGPGRRGLVPEKVERVEEFALVVLARKAVVVKRPVRIGLGSFLSQDLRIMRQIGGGFEKDGLYYLSLPSQHLSIFTALKRGHPSMYDDLSGPYHRGDENLRYSRRILNKHSCDGSENSTPKQQKSCSSEESSENSSREGSPEDPSPKRRAKVPPWSGCNINNGMDDSKWLGTQIWAPELEEDKVSTDQSSIGRGRQDSCTCELPGSVECVRFHVAENRLRLKRELDRAFYDWKFQQMGEEISLSWSAEEEEKFKSIVCLKAQSPDTHFWVQLFESFPTRSPQSLVSYYFNVFLLRRRSYQNRVTPMNIDSDDEEGEFGFLSNRLGNDSLQPRGSRKVVCAENTQVINLEEYIDLDTDLEDS